MKLTENFSEEFTFHSWDTSDSEVLNERRRITKVGFGTGWRGIRGCMNYLKGDSKLEISSVDLKSDPFPDYCQ